MSNVRAFGHTKENRNAEELLRDSLSLVSKERADGKSVGALVVLIPEDTDCWPKVDFACGLDGLIISSRLLEAVVDRVIDEHGGIGEYSVPDVPEEDD